MNNNLLRANLSHPQSRIEIIQEFCRGKSVLDIGCVHHDIDNADKVNWLHKAIVEVASETTGVDYLIEAVQALQARGYNAVVGDVNKELPITGQFDVIVVGNLIEHLSNFEGLLTNIRRLLKANGVALVSTANPFFREQYFYSALTNRIIVNPEHTCWLDPVTMDQLCRRFGLETTEVRWVREKWQMQDTIFDGCGQTLDMFTGKWSFAAPPSILERFVGPLLRCLAARFMKRRFASAAGNYGPLLERYLYLRFKGLFAEAAWRMRRIVIPHAPINDHELYVSVLRMQCRTNDAEQVSE